MDEKQIPVRSAKLAYQPEDVGYLPDTITVLDKHLSALIERKRLSAAAYLMSRDNKIFAHRAMGRLRRDNEQSLFLPDSIRGIASVTKFFVAVSIMQLVEQGVMRIDQPVREILSEFDTPMHGKISIKHLLTHTSGIRPDPGCMFEPYPRDWEWFDSKEWIREALRDNINFEPGTQWRYSSTGFAILGEIVSRKSGIHFEKYVHEKILKPLGMHDTFFDVPQDKAMRLCLNWQYELDRFNKPEERHEWAAPRAGGGLYSTLGDLQKFGQMLLNKGTLDGARILGRKTVESMTHEYLVESNARSYAWGAGGVLMEYGLGFNVYYRDSLLSPGSFSHEGSGLCGLYMDPVERFVFAYFCPLADDVGWEPEAVLNPRTIAWSGIL